MLHPQAAAKGGEVLRATSPVISCPPGDDGGHIIYNNVGFCVVLRGRSETGALVPGNSDKPEKRSTRWSERVQEQQSQKTKLEY